MTGGNVLNRPKMVGPPLIVVLYSFNGYNLCFCVTLHLRARVDVLSFTIYMDMRKTTFVY